MVTRAENDFKLVPEDVEALITEKTKLLILSYPNNPTGAVMSREELERIAQVAVKHDLLVLTDEIYAELSYGMEFTSIASLPGMRERTVVVSLSLIHILSKRCSSSSAFPAWRARPRRASRMDRSATGRLTSFSRRRRRRALL